MLVAAGEAGRRLVTLNAEAQVTVGTALLHAGYSITEAHGDQPGALAELDPEVRAIGFDPVAYVNFKGFHDPDPSPENMHYWSQKQASTLRAVTSYTDGGKLQIEQVLVANGLGAGIARPGHDRRRRSTTCSTSTTWSRRPTRSAGRSATTSCTPRGRRGC